MFHWCYQETETVALSIPIVGITARKIYQWCHKLFKGRKHNHDQCISTHLISKNKEPPSNFIKLTISQVDDKFGQLATILLSNDRNLLEVNYFPSINEFSWFVDQDKYLVAYWNGKMFNFFEDDQEWFEDDVELEEDLSIDVVMDND